MDPPDDISETEKEIWRDNRPSRQTKVSAVGGAELQRMPSQRRRGA